ncbi:MAG: DUF6268 family outer membrane beta-barrel protein [Acidobacteriota bacterium]
MKNIKHLTPVVFAMSILCAGSVHADKPSASFDLNLTSFADLEFTDSLATVDLQSAEVSLGFFDFTLSASVHDFTWSEAEDLSFANGAPVPWEQMKRVSLRHTSTRPINDRFFLLTSVGAGLGFEEESTDSHFADALAAVIWNRSSEWSFLFGVGYSWHSAVDVEFEAFPAIGLTYRGQAEKGFTASLGIPETSLRYRFSPRSSLGLGVGATTFVTRLADDSPVVSAGYSEFIQFDVGLTYEVRIRDRLSLEIGPTYGLEGELKIHDSEGILLSTHDLEPAAGGKFQLKLSF